MIKKLLLALLVIVMLVIPVLTACGTSTSSTTTTTSTSKPPTSSTTSTPPPTSSTSMSPTSSTSVPPPTSTAAGPTKINIALAATIATLDPTQTNGGGQQAAYDVFESLLDFDKNNQVVGKLADSWTVAPDGLSITVKLKSGIVFSTGDPLTAQDVEFTINRYSKVPGPTAAQLGANVYSGMAIIDPLTVKFNFPAINIQFLTQTLPGMLIISKTQYDKLGEDEFVKNTAGTGPYKFTGYAEGQYVDMTYNDKWRGAKPQITDAHIVFTADSSTRISQLQAGEVDMIWDVPAGSVAQLTSKGFSRFDIVQPHDICLQFAYVDTTVPWAKVDVRKAMNYAIDKDSVNKTLFGGVFQKAVWLESWELGYDPSLDPSYPYDIGQAKQLMTSAGYANGFTMNLYYPTFMSWSKDMVDYLTGTFSQIGIVVKPQPLSDFGAMIGTWQSLHANDGKTAPGVILFDVGWPGNPVPIINLTNGFAYSLKDNVLFNDPELDKIIQEALVTVDTAKEEQLIKQAYTIINNTLPFVPILLEVTVICYNNNITYTQSHGGMNYGPVDLFDLTIK